MDNKLHGYMLHQDSAYNLFEDNISYGNEDGFVVYESNFNTVRNNSSYNARSAAVRVNRPSNNTYIINNKLFGGKRGVFLYDGAKNTLIADNAIHQTGKALQTQGASNTLVAGNTIDALLYDIGPKDGQSMVYGANTIQADKNPLPTASSVRASFVASHPQTRLPR
jgi:parallel beta-helix repeat protein